jgi:hypothetical protein
MALSAINAFMSASFELRKEDLQLLFGGMPKPK